MGLKDVKSEKGSITLFVLIAMLFFLIIAFGIYVSNRNAQQSQMKEIDRIIAQYQKNESIEQVYNNIVLNENN